MHPRRHIDRNAGPIADRGNGLERRAIDGSAQSGAENCIDNTFASIKDIRRQRLGLTRPPVGVESRIARERFDLTEQPHTNGLARFFEITRRNETVAAIVSRAAQDRDAAAAERQHGIRDGLARDLHQSLSGRAGCDGGCIGRRHFSHGQQTVQVRRLHLPASPFD